MTRIQSRTVSRQALDRLSDAGLHPLLARLYAARGISRADELDTSLKHMLPPEALTGTRAAAQLLADAIEAGARMVIVADYDCDGATACAVGMRALRAFGADVHYLVPDRVTLGYGLTPAMVEIAARLEPDLLITVDNGIASVEGIAAARAHGMATIITDHHLPGDELPDADVIVNPNQPGCDFPSKALAGVGAMFYTMLALRAELRERGAFAGAREPNLADLLDLVALGTVADVVRLDRNNRILVAQGLARMRAGRLQPGVRALFSIAGRDPARASTTDLGFMIGPRLNAAGRLSDMSLGIECLVTDDAGRAMHIAQELDRLNRERRSIEAGMQEEALARLAGNGEVSAGGRATIALFEPDWHQGVIGIVAGRIKEKLHRPTIAFARSSEGELKGSGRSIPGLHLRDALDLVTKRHPDLIVRFGGHAMAAGLTIREADLRRFDEAFEEVVGELLDPAQLEHRIETDGSLEPGYFALDAVRMLDNEIWGQGFPAPLFDDVFRVERQRVLKDKHLKLELSRGATRFEAIRFNHADAAAGQIHAAYRIGINEYNGVSSVQLMLEHFDAA
ncbi:single-stranded-DNA-specific exonuclease RecJ [Thauera linaloolentis]|uniref:Single-stranded-DNA-specific exonuclease RecJ n=1 Tax=Thauera linaloolentis (strain DSM 12138 / JCM 21573 / CCUG 41526 / CIP 105981 / IAM 15112 / NBRC 102519 / 47Lol) TaxID=1123367 RepID=N6XXL2_THAL4|nr:single-stranded-DNA-specific exonuclease RecJ [Thauera linaloolentis]ENO84005.1 single-stranded-DNA-specific exonuclease RecJ [Thauera linaloolentis 47Lol = DSM 12138]MCM8565812.1 single-stranded-DNA-specific exonuclease RecJ [Thauera linaloolentis]